MERAEAAETAVKAAHAQVVAQQAQLDADRRQVAVLITEKKQELAGLKQEQADLRTAMDPDILRTYDRVASSKKTAPPGRRIRNALPARCNYVRRPGTTSAPALYSPAKAAAVCSTSMPSSSRRARAAAAPSRALPELQHEI